MKSPIPISASGTITSGTAVQNIVQPKAEGCSAGLERMEVAGSPGDVTLEYKVWDVDFDIEVEILVNGIHLDQPLPESALERVRQVDGVRWARLVRIQP